MATFPEVRELLERYYWQRLTQKLERRAEHLIHELRARLRQMQWMHTRMLTLEEAYLYIIELTRRVRRLEETVVEFPAERTP
ncbi:MAG: hypothetical protein FJW23_14575 [Acidimicrobiia bacterium]|nr:hypothetical protein [Acidimicrobiia bacterium]